MSTVLTDDERARIWNEETYRKEVREQLASKKGSWTDLLNTPVAIAILGALLTLLGSLMALFVDSVSQQGKAWHEKIDRREKIAREIEHRCAVASPSDALDSARALNGELPVAVAYPDLQGIKLYALALELEPLVFTSTIKARVSSLSEFCRTDLNKLEIAKLTEIRTKAQELAKDILPK